MTLVGRISTVITEIGLDVKSIKASYWSLLGNAGTNPTTNFIGTTDAQPLVFRTNNAERIRILSAGNVGVGNINPSVLLTVGTGDNSNTIRLRVEGAIQGSANGGGLLLIDGNNQQIFRGLVSALGVNNTTYTYFQLGGSNAAFTGVNGSVLSRVTTLTSSYQISSGNNVNTPLPVGVFEVRNATTAFMNIFTTGNVSINSSTDSGFKLDVNGTARIGNSTVRAEFDTVNGQYKFRGANGNFGIDLGYYAANSGGYISSAYNGINLLSTVYWENGAEARVVTRHVAFNWDIYSAASWNIRELTSSNILFKVNANGNVLIGTSVDSGYKLNVVGTGRFSGLMISSLPNVSMLATDTNGNIIAGTPTGSSNIQEYQNINVSNPVGDSIYYNKKTTNTGEVRMYIMGMPVYTQKSEIYLTANTSEGVKQIGLK